MHTEFVIIIQNLGIFFYTPCRIVLYLFFPALLTIFNYLKWFKSYEKSRGGCFFKYMRNSIRVKFQQFSGQNEQKSDSFDSNLFKFAGDTLQAIMKNYQFLIFSILTIFGHFQTSESRKMPIFAKKTAIFKIQMSKNGSKKLKNYNSSLWPKEYLQQT